MTDDDVFTAYMDDCTRQLKQAAVRRRRPRGRRVALLAIAGALATGTTAAAVVQIASRDEPSRRLAGSAPAGSGQFKYDIDFAPDLTAGNIGWCMSVRLTGSLAGRGTGCGLSRAHGSPIIAGGAIGAGPAGLLSGPRTAGAQQGIIGYMVVAPQIAAIQTAGDRRIRPRRDARIPGRWRVAVWLDTGGFQTPRAIDSAGRARFSRTGSRPPGAIGSRQQGTRRVDPAEPPTGTPCAIRVPDSSGLRPGDERVIQRLQRHRPDVAGRPFLSCAHVAVHRNGTRYRVALLLDAQQPRARADVIPGASGAGAQRVSKTMSARRVGVGWLVVRGGNADGRDLVLARVEPRIGS